MHMQFPFSTHLQLAAPLWADVQLPNAARVRLFYYGHPARAKVHHVCRRQMQAGAAGRGLSCRSPPEGARQAAAVTQSTVESSAQR